MDHRTIVSFFTCQLVWVNRYLRGIGRLDMGLASIGGLGIVLLAIVLDRLTQAMGQPDRTRTGRWYQRGPAALLLRLAGRDKKIDYKGVNA